MNILVILEGFEECCGTIDKVLELSKAYGLVMGCDYTQYATSIGDEVISTTYVLLSGVTFQKYYKFFSKEIFHEKLIIVYDLAEQQLASRIIKCKAMNSMHVRDFNYKSILHLMIEPRNLNELSNYLLEFKENDIKKLLKYKPNNKADIGSDNSIYQLNKDRSIKVIGLFSPFSTGKTTLAALMATSLASTKRDVLLIDTDTLKKDLIYHFTFDDTYYARFSGMIQAIDRGQGVELEENLIRVSNKIYIASDHRDTNYSIKESHIKYLIENTRMTTIIIDISKDYKDVELNEILKLCNHRLLVLDKNVCNMNNISKLLNLQRTNRDVDVVFNREFASGIISDREALNVINYDKSLNIHNVYKVDEDYKSIIKNLSKRKTAYKKSKPMSNSIDTLVNSIYGDKKKINLYSLISKGVRYGNKA